MTFDRASQFNPLTQLTAEALKARLADDAATTAMDAQQSTVDALTRQTTAIFKKVMAGVATDEEYVTFGQANAQLKVESAKLPALQSAQADTHVAWDIARTKLRAQIDSLDQNPGQVEAV